MATTNTNPLESASDVGYRSMANYFDISTTYISNVLPILFLYTYLYTILSMSNTIYHRRAVLYYQTLLCT